jgi:hypothetical protein
MSIIAPIAGIDLVATPEYNPQIIQQMIANYLLTNEIHPHMLQYAATCNNVVMLGELLRRWPWGLANIMLDMDYQQLQCMQYAIKYSSLYLYLGAPNFA